MMRGARRGCVKLKGAVIGIDGEDDIGFSITSSSMDDPKVFHFQTRNCDEREKWVRALEDTISRHSHAVIIIIFIVYLFVKKKIMNDML